MWQMSDCTMKTILAAGLFMVLCGAAAAQKNFHPGAVWMDESGEPIQAHGGGILRYKGMYYWYGEDKSEGYLNKVGVSCYASQDLLHWKHVSTALPSANMPQGFGATGICERPKVIYNRQTHTFVMWMHLDHPGYVDSLAGVAVSEKPEGPFRFVKAFSPIAGSTYRDMNLYEKKDGTAYTVFSGDNNASLYIVKLNSSYTDVERPQREGVNWVVAVRRQYREAPAIFYYKGLYYMICSGTSGWAPNAARYYTSLHLLGTWKAMGNPFTGANAATSDRSQATYVLPVAHKPGWFIYMGDRWKPQNLADSRYIWLPFHIRPNGDFLIHWKDTWNFNNLASSLNTP